jgi:hypothetical protein
VRENMEGLTPEKKKEVEEAVDKMVSNLVAMAGEVNKVWFSPTYRFLVWKGTEGLPIAFFEDTVDPGALTVLILASSKGACKLALVKAGKIDEMVDTLLANQSTNVIAEFPEIQYVGDGTTQ